MPWNRVLAAGGVAGLAALAGRYAAGVARAGRSRPVQVEGRLGDLGEVDEVSILPLVERLTPDGSGLAGEPGVSSVSMTTFGTDLIAPGGGPPPRERKRAVGVVISAIQTPLCEVPLGLTVPSGQPPPPSAAMIAQSSEDGPGHPRGPG